MSVSMLPYARDRRDATRAPESAPKLQLEERPRPTYSTDTIGLTLGASDGAVSRLDRALLQLRSAVAGANARLDDPHAVAASGVNGGGSPLPFADTIQQSFGKHDVSNVQAHVGGAATTACDALGAKAYATGHSVAFASSPDLHTAAHEAAHVIQQRAGVSLKGGVGQAGDTYEQHADAVADAVVAGKSAESLLDAYAGAGSGSGRSAVQRTAIQFKEDEQLEARVDDMSQKELEDIVANKDDHPKELVDLAKKRLSEGAQERKLKWKAGSNDDSGQFDLGSYGTGRNANRHIESDGSSQIDVVEVVDTFSDGKKNEDESFRKFNSDGTTADDQDEAEQEYKRNKDEKKKNKKKVKTKTEGEIVSNSHTESAALLEDQGVIPLPGGSLKWEWKLLAGAAGAHYGLGAGEEGLIGAAGATLEANLGQFKAEASFDALQGEFGGESVGAKVFVAFEAKAGAQAALDLAGQAGGACSGVQAGATTDMSAPYRLGGEAGGFVGAEAGVQGGVKVVWAKDNMSAYEDQLADVGAVLITIVSLAGGPIGFAVGQLANLLGADELAGMLIEAMLDWGPTGDVDLISLIGELKGRAGLGAEAKAQLSLSGGKLSFDVGAGVTVGLGAKVGCTFALDAVQGPLFLLISGTELAGQLKDWAVAEAEAAIEELADTLLEVGTDLKETGEDLVDGAEYVAEEAGLIEAETTNYRDANADVERWARLLQGDYLDRVRINEWLDQAEAEGIYEKHRLGQRDEDKGLDDYFGDVADEFAGSARDDVALPFGTRALREQFVNEMVDNVSEFVRGKLWEIVSGFHEEIRQTFHEGDRRQQAFVATNEAYSVAHADVGDWVEHEIWWWEENMTRQR